jgi:phosphoribosylglycinamide formyltransferase-1
VATLSLGVLVSGSGTNLQAILDAIAEGRLDASVKVVISNKSDARALDRARSANVPVQVVSHKDHADRSLFDAALVSALRARGAEWVVCAGFMRILTPVLLRAFKDRVINIHPALLPAFPGVHAQAQALAYGVKVTGCSVHFVDEGVDSGPIIAQRTVPVLDDDSEESLSRRLLVEEHALFVEVLRWISQGRVELVPGAGDARARVRVKPA